MLAQPLLEGGQSQQLGGSRRARAGLPFEREAPVFCRGTPAETVPYDRRAHRSGETEDSPKISDPCLPAAGSRQRAGSSSEAPIDGPARSWYVMESPTADSARS